MGLVKYLLQKSHHLKLDIFSNNQSIEQYFIGVKIAIKTVRDAPFSLILL
jgi:hypothetical protein